MNNFLYYRDCPKYDRVFQSGTCAEYLKGQRIAQRPNCILFQNNEMSRLFVDDWQFIKEWFAEGTPIKPDIRKWLGRCRSSHRKCSVKKAVLKNFAIFTGKYLC